jgi:EGF-like domain
MILHKNSYNRALTSILILVNVLLFINLFPACRKACPVLECKNGGIEMECNCRCPTGYSGPDCGLKCPDCKNGGTCKDGSCRCPAGWTGADCTKRANICEGVNPCQNAGICVNGACKCPPGCFGEFCEKCNSVEIIRPRPQEKLCVERVGNGDDDFAGGKVRVNMRGQISIKNQREVWMHLEVQMVQVEHSHRNPPTVGRGKWDILLWEAQKGQIIQKLDKVTAGTFNYTDISSGLDVCSFSNNCFDRFVVNAETEGPDFGQCTLFYSYVSVYFSDIAVTLAPK